MPHDTREAASGGKVACLATPEMHLRDFASSIKVPGARVRLDLTEMPYIGSSSYSAEVTAMIGEAVSAYLAASPAALLTGEGEGLVSAAWDLLRACEKDMETNDPTDAEDEPVGGSEGGPTAVQFGHMRRLRKALETVPASLAPALGTGEGSGGASELQPKIETCPKCGAQGVAFICDVQGCPVNGGAAYPWTPHHPQAPNTLSEVEEALANCAEAVAFFDQVKRSSPAEQAAVGADHWNWLESACRRAATLHASQEQDSEVSDVR